MSLATSSRGAQASRAIAASSSCKPRRVRVAAEPGNETDEGVDSTLRHDQVGQSDNANAARSLNKRLRCLRDAPRRGPDRAARLFVCKFEQPTERGAACAACPQLHCAGVDLACGSIDRNFMTFLKDLASDREGPARKVDRDRFAADDARFVERARNDGRVAERAARRGHDASGAEHPAYVLGAGGRADENDGLDLRRRFGRAVRIEHRGSVRVTRRGTQALCEQSRLRQRVLVESRTGELADLVGLDAADRFASIDQAFASEVRRDLHRCDRRTLGRAHLQHVEASRLRR